MLQKILFIVFWFAVAPFAVARMAGIVTRERITDGLRAYVEARWPGTLLDYLIHCPVCVSHWAALLLTLSNASIWQPILRHPDNPVASLAIFVVVWLATTEIAIRFWLPKEEVQ